MLFSSPAGNDLLFDEKLCEQGRNFSNKIWNAYRFLSMNIKKVDTEFEKFKDCFSAMSRIAFECEALNHHPNWSNVYNVLTISLSTHDANGVTDKDFKLAEAIESIVEVEE